MIITGITTIIMLVCIKSHINISKKLLDDTILNSTDKDLK